LLYLCPGEHGRQEEEDVLSIQGKPGRISRRAFLGLTGMSAAALMLGKGPLHSFGARVAMGQPTSTTGYGPLTPKGDLALPPGFWYQRVSQQGKPMSDGKPTPGIFDGMGAFPDDDDDEGGSTTILIRNHENRERPGEIKVVTGPEYEYDEAMFGGNTKLVVSRRREGQNPDRTPRYVYTVERDFAILGGTSTNCAGGVVGSSWVTCEEVVKGPAGGSDSMVAPKRHGYTFEVPAYADGPVEAVPIRAAGRFVHEAVAWLDGILYETEDRGITPDQQTQKRLLGACFYRFIPSNVNFDDDDGGGRRPRFANARGRLQALKLKNEYHANMDVGREVGKSYPVEWVTVADPDHDDDTDDRRDRQPGFTPTRVQAQDRGAAFFDRQEGIWVAREGDDDNDGGKIYFDCTAGGESNEGQVWEYDPDRETITLIFESQTATEDGSNEQSGGAFLNNPDNIVIVPQTGHIFLQEDSEGAQYVRGLTRKGQIYDFARTVTNDTEFCGGCFSPDGKTFYLNQQGERGSLPDGPPDSQAVTYAIYGPFGRLADDD
jgi:secreted PhoX family phosphatase